MDISGWNTRYRERNTSDVDAPPTKLLVQAASALRPGLALDLASGTGRNALWLAQAGWQVTAVDGSAEAIVILQEQAQGRGLSVKTEVADLQGGNYELGIDRWDLVAICYYLGRNLIEPAKRSVRPGGCIVVIVHTTEGSEQPTQSRLRPGELAAYFDDWEILHRYEGKPDDPAHKRSVAEVVARKP